LQWDQEIDVPSLKSKIFIIPGELVMNGDERVVVLNRIALSVVNSVRGKHPTHVFSFRGKPVNGMLNSAWHKARIRAGLPEVRVHDLKHTFGRRLRAAGVTFEDRQDLLGHRSVRITIHYPAAELSRLIEAANSICDRGTGRRELVVLRRLNVG
jgi:integrase